MQPLRCCVAIVAVVVGVLVGASADAAIHAYDVSHGASAEAIDHAELSEARIAVVSHETETSVRFTGGATRAYDPRVVPPVDTSGPETAEGPSPQVTAGGGGIVSPCARGEDTSTTTSLLTRTPISSRLVPGGGLAAHEGAGGHALARHLGKSDADLLARVRSQPNIAGASTWSSRATAEASIAEVLSANSSGVQSWLAGSGNKLVLNGGGSSTVGRYVAQGSSSVQNVAGVRVVLVRDPSLGIGYRIQTAFPTP
ncbi:MAG: RNase A-like domain-containing protein [Microthrixaceae bacterium]